MNRGSYKVTTPPAAEPITLAEARQHLNFTADDPTDDDAYIEALISVARDVAEQYTNRAIMTQDVTLVLPCFPVVDGYRNPLASIRLFKSPVQQVKTIYYRDEDDADHTLNVEDNTILNSYAEPATLSPNLVNMPDGWPATNPDRPNAVTIVYTAGYESASLVPKAIKQAMLLMIGKMFSEREDSVKQLPTAAEYLLNPYVIREY